MENKDSRSWLSAGVALFALVLVVSGCTPMSAIEVSGDAEMPTATPAAFVSIEPIRVSHRPLREPPASRPADDLLERLRVGFELTQNGQAAVDAEIAWYARNEAYLQRVFERSEWYLYHIAATLEERGMPSDLALLPVVESAFDPFAYSHGRAAGLWQIIPSTGQRLGLKQNWWFDARRDVPEATRAALDYLQALHMQFDGDWLLAVAAYNSGEGNVARAIDRARTHGHATDFWGIREYLPAETRTYVPRLLAIQALVADPQSHGIRLPPIPNEPRLALVDTGGQIDMTLAASLAGVAVDQLYRLNPGVNRWATDPDGPHRLVVPIDKRQVLIDALADLGDRERVQWTRYRIAAGDTLGQLARQFHTTPELLKEINGLPSSTIIAGDDLMIPHAINSLTEYTASLEARIARQLNVEREGARRAHVVRGGESLWSIAQRYRVGVRELASWNAMAPGDVLGIGRELVVWSDAAAVTTASSPDSAPAQIRKLDYVVRRGDSLAAIARKFKVTLGQLIEWNEIDVARYLQPGQQLVVFVDVNEQSS